MSIELIHGDCLEVMKDLSANSIDCFICDLPYGCLTQGFARKNHNEEIAKKVSTLSKSCCDWDIKIDLVEFWKQVERLMKNDHTPILMFCNTKFGYELIKSNEKWFRYDLVWNKERGVSFLSANKMPMKSHEMIYVFSKKSAFYNRIDIEGNYPNTHRCPLSILNFKNSIVSGKHPTEKPIELYKWLIERYCPKEGTILDPTAGSFNSCFAGFELNKKCIGIEKDDNFYTKACEKADLM